MEECINITQSYTPSFKLFIFNIYIKMHEKHKEQLKWHLKKNYKNLRIPLRFSIPTLSDIHTVIQYDLPKYMA